MSLRLVVLGFGARRRSNLCFRGVDFFVGSPFYPSCFISSAVDFLVFFCLWCRMSVESVCVGGEGERECTGAKCGSLGGRMLAASLDFYKDSSALEANER